MREAGRVGYLAFGVFLLFLGTVLAVSGNPVLLWAGWVCFGLGAVLAVAHVAVGPRRVGGGRPGERA